MDKQPTSIYIDFEAMHATIYYNEGEHVEIVPFKEFAIHTMSTDDVNKDTPRSEHQRWLRTELHYTHHHELISEYNQRSTG